MTKYPLATAITTLIASLGLEAHQGLARQLEDHAIRKTYRAICVGVPEPRDGDWREAIGPLGEQLLKKVLAAHTSNRPFVDTPDYVGPERKVPPAAAKPA